VLCFLQRSTSANTCTTYQCQQSTSGTAIVPSITQVSSLRTRYVLASQMQRGPLVMWVLLYFPTCTTDISVVYQKPSLSSYWAISVEYWLIVKPCLFCWWKTYLAYICDTQQDAHYENSLWCIHNTKLKNVTVSFTKCISPHVTDRELQITLALNFTVYWV
jgi:hypothetical protein